MRIIDRPAELIHANAYPVCVLLHAVVKYGVKLLSILQLVVRWPSILVSVNP